MCTALVLGTHDWSSGPKHHDVARLTGRTSDGLRIQMFVLDGKLQSFDTHVKVRCGDGESRQWRWYPADGVPVPFHQHGGRFVVREGSTSPSSGQPSAFGNEMHGRLAGDGRSASGTLTSGAFWTGRNGWTTCNGRARFSARAQG